MNNWAKIKAHYSRWFFAVNVATQISRCRYLYTIYTCIFGAQLAINLSIKFAFAQQQPQEDNLLMICWECDVTMGRGCVVCSLGRNWTVNRFLVIYFDIYFDRFATPSRSLQCLQWTLLLTAFECLPLYCERWKSKIWLSFRLFWGTPKSLQCLQT